VSIRKLPSGRWQVRLDDTRATRGPRSVVSLGTFTRKGDAQQAEREARTRLERGESLAASDDTLGALFERFLAETESRYSGSTVYTHRKTWGYVGKLAARRAVDLKPTDLTALYTRLLASGGVARQNTGRHHSAGGALSPRTVGQVHALIRTVLSWAVQLEILPRNVARLVSPPKIAAREAVPYTADQAQVLIAAARVTRYWPLIVVGFSTGLRRGELAALRWEDVDLERRIATIRSSIAVVPGKKWLKGTKQGRIGTLALSDVAIVALEAQREQQARDRAAFGRYPDLGYVFAGQWGGTPNPDALGHAVRAIARQAGLPVAGMHAMRHAVATWLLRAGVDIRTVSAVMRHASPTMTLRVYSHEIAGAQAEAVRELDRILDIEAPRPGPDKIRGQA